jgi:ATP-dependent DNA ligase
LTKAKMADCRWLKPVLVGQFELLEWTDDNHLRHTRFVGLREDNVLVRSDVNNADWTENNSV